MNPSTTRAVLDSYCNMYNVSVGVQPACTTVYIKSCCRACLLPDHLNGSQAVNRLLIGTNIQIGLTEYIFPKVFTHRSKSLNPGVKITSMVTDV